MRLLMVGYSDRLVLCSGMDVDVCSIVFSGYTEQYTRASC